MLLAVCIPVKSEFVSLAWAIQLRRLRLPPHAFFIVKGRPIHCARNELVRNVLRARSEGEDYRYVLFLDSDVIPCSVDWKRYRDLLSRGLDRVSAVTASVVDDPDVIMKMIRTMEERGVDILAGLYWAKRHGWCAYKLSEHGLRPLTTEEILSSTDDLIEVDAVGFGLVLVRTEVFEKIEPPWFDWVEDASTGRIIMSEDIYFCRKARKRGFRVFVDRRVVGIHVAEACKLYFDNVVVIETITM